MEPRDLRQLERTREVLERAAEPRCLYCFGPADRIIAGRRNGLNLADCEKCRAERKVAKCKGSP